MIFNVLAFNKKGKKIKTVMEAADVEELNAYLSFCELELISFKTATFTNKLFTKQKRVTPLEKIEVLESLHLVIKSGIPLSSGLKEIVEDTDNPAVKDVLNRISFKTSRGESFSNAVSSCGGLFGETIQSLIKIGEQTGTLDITLKDAGNHIKQTSDLRAEIKQAMLYPAFAFFSLLFALMFWLIYVMPEMAKTFQAFDANLPALTIAVLNISGFLKSYGLALLFISISLTALFFYLRKTDGNFKFKTDELSLKLPIIGKLLTLFNLAFFAEYIRLMTSSGLPLYNSLVVMENSFTNTAFRHAVTNIKEDVGRGKSFSESISAHDIFPSLLVRMVNIGEQTGHLSEQLSTASEHYFSKAERMAKNMSKVLEPVIIGFVGTFMLIIFIGLLSPIFSLISGIN